MDEGWARKVGIDIHFSINNVIHFTHLHLSNLRHFDSRHGVNVQTENFRSGESDDEALEFLLVRGKIAGLDA